MGTTSQRLVLRDLSPATRRFMAMAERRVQALARRFEAEAAAH